MKTTGKKIIAGAVSSAFLLGMFPTAVFANADAAAQAALTTASALQYTIDTEEATSATVGFANGEGSLDALQIGRYSAGMSDPEGGVMEIVDYNSTTGWAYAINGKSGKLVAISLNDLQKGDSVISLDGAEIDVKALVEANEVGFLYGDMTSVAVSPDGKLLATAVQADAYDADGRVVLFRCNKDGSLTFKKAFTAGVQPDMVTFTPDGSKILTANEGEPRNGYGENDIDPEGSVTVVDIASQTAQTVGFGEFDHDALAQEGIVLKKGATPAVDLEPEYIAADNDKAYITLQEANAIAELDLYTSEFTGIYSVGFEDHSRVAIDLGNDDDTYAPSTYEALLGIRMPDAINLYKANGKTYLLTANEGDSRAWPVETEAYSNEIKNKKSPNGKKFEKKVTWFDAEQYDGLQENTDYLFGGRSFTLFEVTDDGLKEVFDSGSIFEEKSAAYLPDFFNCSNDSLALEDRSGKKGPEAETVVTGKVGDKMYVFITQERIGGVMMFDITNPAQSKFVNYINSRDFNAPITADPDEDEDAYTAQVAAAADNSPEGLKFVSAAESPTGEALLLAACEVGGTVAVYELTGQSRSDSNTSSGSSSGFSGVYNYPVKVESSDNATVSLSKNNAVAGEKVIVTVTPKQDQQVDSITVTDANGKELTITKINDTQYSFVMPAGAVKVTATTTAVTYDKKIVLQINNKTITVNGRAIQSDTAPIIVDDRTMVPIRVITETLGGTVDWSNRTVTLTIDDKQLQMTIGQTIDGFDEAPIIRNNRTYVPMRYVAEALGANVVWEERTQQIIVTK